MPEVNDAEAKALATKFELVPAEVFAGALAVGSKAALNIKNNLKDDAKRSRYFTLASSISYTRKTGPLRAEFEIGPDKERSEAANLANIAYFGGARGGGGTLDFDGPAQKELDVIEDYLDAAIRKALP